MILSEIFFPSYLTYYYFVDQLENVDYLPEDWWLQILITKYKNEILTKEESDQMSERDSESDSLSLKGSNNPLSPIGHKYHPYLPPITRFSIFISFCLLGDIDCTSEEEAALFKVPFHTISLYSSILHQFTHSLS